MIQVSGLGRSSISVRTVRARRIIQASEDLQLPGLSDAAYQTAVGSGKVHDACGIDGQTRYVDRAQERRTFQIHTDYVRDSVARDRRDDSPRIHPPDAGVSGVVDVEFSHGVELQIPGF